jgi:hypothetical protein
LKSKRVLIALILVWLLFLGISTAANPTNDFEAVKWRSFYPGEVQHVERSYNNDPHYFDYTKQELRGSFFFVFHPIQDFIVQTNKNAESLSRIDKHFYV